VTSILEAGIYLEAKRTARVMPMLGRSLGYIMNQVSLANVKGKG
jgi:hypothetical protein